MASNNNLRFLNFTLPRSAQSYTSINHELERTEKDQQFATLKAHRGSLIAGHRITNPIDVLHRKLNHFHSAQELNAEQPFHSLNNTNNTRDKQINRDEFARKHAQVNIFPSSIKQSNNSINNSQSLPRAQSQKIITVNDISQSRSEPKRILIIRHGERVDSTFGLNWLDIVFDSNGKYRRINLNLPRTIPQRKTPKDFIFDPPLTEVGLMHSKLIGEELEAAGTHIKYCYCSPALRCIQTATKILEGMQKSNIAIRIEPCLFEFLKWHPVMPLKSPFMDIEELRNNGFYIDKTYKTIYPLESLRKDEDEAMYYTRSHTVMMQIIRNHDTKVKLTNENGKTNEDVAGSICKADNILIVGHAPTLEVTTRQLTGGSPRVSDLKFLVRQIPYLSIQNVERQTDGLWKLRKPPIPPMKHGAVEPFDWRYMR